MKFLCFLVDSNALENKREDKWVDLSKDKPPATLGDTEKDHDVLTFSDAHNQNICLNI